MSSPFRKSLFAIAASASFLAGCANIPEGAGQNPADPWEKFNRNVAAFNDAADAYVIEPIARGYRAITPQPVRTAVSNVFSNLHEPSNAINSALQAKPEGFFGSLFRLIVNTTIGLGGIFDVAGSVAGIAEEKQDFGKTLGVWGVPSGPYLELPILGPSSVRDGPALLADWLSRPTTYVDNKWISLGSLISQGISTRAELLPFTDTLKNAVDPYVMKREAYLALRRAEISGKTDNVEGFAVDEFEDEDEKEAKKK